MSLMNHQVLLPVHLKPLPFSLLPHTHKPQKESKSAELTAEGILDFQKSEIPGEAFVSVSKGNPTGVEGAMEIFRSANLMLPKPIRKYLWTEFIYNGKVSENNIINNFDWGRSHSV